MSHHYVRTIARNEVLELEVRKSRFISHCFRVTDDSEARGIIDQTRKLYWDANHNCTAWRIGARGNSQRTSDDGEPAGTAGVPMLDVLLHRDLTDVLVIVTRYFGGIKLGAGGLIRAYGSACSAVLDAAGIVERRPLHRLVAEVQHGDAGRFENLLRATDFDLADVDYTANGVEFSVHLAPECMDSFTEWFAATTSGMAPITDLGTFEVEVPLALDETARSTR